MHKMTSFKLPNEYLAGYKDKDPLQGFEGLSFLTFMRTYSRVMPNGLKESWFDTVRRVVEGTYSMQKDWTLEKGLKWDEEKANGSALRMFDKIFNMKFLPPGRGLWAMGTKMTTERKNFMCLNNCAFISTANIAKDYSMPFKFLMDVSMLGVGCGFDAAGAGKITINKPCAEKLCGDNAQGDTAADRAIKSHIEFLSGLICEHVMEINKLYQSAKAPSQAKQSGGFCPVDFMVNSHKSVIAKYRAEIERHYALLGHDVQIYKVPDTREGWVEAIGKLLDSFFKPEEKAIIFDYTQIRPKGLLLKNFGGYSSGPEPLIELSIDIYNLLMASVGKPISITNIADIMNLIGKCVVAGNVRRSSEICLGPDGDEEFLNLKNYEKNPHRISYGWNSNNSVFADFGTDYNKYIDSISNNGEPGFIWLQNCQKYSRMNGIVDDKDWRAAGTNPCGEQTLEHGEVCNLVEVFIHKHDSIDEFLDTLKYAFLYAKTVTLGDIHWKITDDIVKRNRRIGTSVSGIVDFLARFIGPVREKIKAENPFIGSDEKLERITREKGLNAGLEELQRWLNLGYDLIKDYDATYSKWLDIPQSIKITSVKPSGCLSGDTMVSAAKCPEGPFSPTPLAQIVAEHVSNNHDLAMGIMAKTSYPVNGPLYVLGQDNRPKSVSHVYINGQDDTYEIPIDGYEPIVCTGGHKLLTLKRKRGHDDEYEWKEAKNIKKDDTIVGY